MIALHSESNLLRAKRRVSYYTECHTNYNILGSYKSFRTESDTSTRFRNYQSNKDLLRPINPYNKNLKKSYFASPHNSHNDNEVQSPGYKNIEVSSESVSEQSGNESSQSPPFSGYQSFDNFQKDILKPKIHPRIKKIEAEEMK